MTEVEHVKASHADGKIAVVCFQPAYKGDVDIYIRDGSKHATGKCRQELYKQTDTS